jgi:hypothetical protein
MLGCYLLVSTGSIRNSRPSPWRGRMEPQPLGAFYGDHEITCRCSQARLREVIALVGISFALAIFFAAGVWGIYWIARGWLALRDQKSIYANN